MPRGGARPGAGRPRKAVQHARPIAKAEKTLADRLPEVAEAMLQLALGVKCLEPDKRNVYLKAPDVKAATYVLDRIMGKPTERTELTGNDGGALRIQAFEAALARTYPVEQLAPKPLPPPAKPKAAAKPKSKPKLKSQPTPRKKGGK